MIQLFKAKSLKKTQKTGAGAGLPTGNKSRKKEKSKGRSMVEMLGVLAIIGVLSIGGIQGYTMAMRKYRANEILNVVQKYAMVVYSGCQQAIQQNPDKYYTELMSDRNDDDALYFDSWICPMIAFSDAGLGSLPSDIKGISLGNNDEEELLVSFNGRGGVTILSFSSGDAVVVLVEFKNKEICEAVMTITGKHNSYYSPAIGTQYFDRDFTCGEQTKGGEYSSVEGYYLTIVTMMN